MRTIRLKYLKGAEQELSSCRPFCETAAIVLLPYFIFSSLERLSLITNVVLQLFNVVHAAPIPIATICGVGNMSGIVVDFEASSIGMFVC